jgi:hypothetical protein
MKKYATKNTSPKHKNKRTNAVKSNLAKIHENKKASKIFCDQGRKSTLQVAEPLPPLPSLPPLSDPRLLWACTF